MDSSALAPIETRGAALIPFTISDELVEFIRWCGGDVYALDYYTAKEWAAFYAWWLEQELTPTASSALI